MNNRNKILAVALLAAMAIPLAPSASAVPLVCGGHTCGDVSRSFYFFVPLKVADGSGGIGGTGWVDTGSRANTCLLSVYGVQTPLPDATYYDQARIEVAVDTSITQTTPNPAETVPLACPTAVNPLPAVGAYAIQVEPQTVTVGARNVVSEDTILCTAIAGAICSANPVTSTWTTSQCTSPSFTANDKFGNVGSILDSASLSPALVLSSGASCPAGTTNTQNALALAGGWLTTSGDLSTDFNTATTGAGGIYNNAPSDYIFSCVGTDVTYVIAVPPTINTYTNTAGDWALGVSPSAPGATALAGQLPGYLGVSSGVPLQGLYDLNGDDSNVAC